MDSAAVMNLLKNGVPISWYLVLSAILFAIGVSGFLFRRNIITVFMCIELMLNAVNLSFIAFAHQHKQVSGQLFTFFVMVVAAAEAAVGLAIILTVFKNRSTLNIDEIGAPVPWFSDQRNFRAKAAEADHQRDRRGQCRALLYMGAAGRFRLRLGRHPAARPVLHVD
jgi:NADH-quinone oxidoreductase subunit K